jgi:membrane protein implicated in regulation of membrane protease activity
MTNTSRRHLLWICPTIGLMAGIAIFWLFGIGFWSVVAFFFLIACPLAVAWVLIVERQESRAPGKQL